MTTPIIDIHCHTFNGDDIALQGFFRRVLFDDKGTLSWLAERWVQSRAPGYEREVAALNLLLGIAVPETAEAVKEIEAEMELTDLRMELGGFIQELAVTDPALHAVAQEALGLPEGAGEERAELFGIGDRLDFVGLLGELRLNLTRRLIADNQPATVFTPMMVDLELWLTQYGRGARTTLVQQVELHDKIAQVSMRGLLEGHPAVRVHPFFGFDPRRVYVDSDRTPPWDMSLLQAAITENGFVGVKVYPPMGFRPSRNFTTQDIRSEAEALAYDSILDEFFGWCEQHQVPVTAHANRSMGTEAPYDHFSSPSEWRRVLERHPGLHLNFGHFGGFNAEPSSAPWPFYFAELAERFANVYVDVGNHRPNDQQVLERYLEHLEQLIAINPKLVDKLMLGTDWFMDVQEPGHEEFVARYLAAFEAQFGAAAAEKFRGGNALRFLGFDDPANLNNRRLTSHYTDNATGQKPEWLA